MVSWGIIKWGIWQPVKFQLVSLSWTGSKLKWFLSHLWINVGNINSEIREINHFISRTRDQLKFYRLSGVIFYDFIYKINYLYQISIHRPQWLSWMRRPTRDQEVTGSTPAEVGNILSWRLIMKYFLRLFSPFRWFKKGSCQFLTKECAQYWLTA